MPELPEVETLRRELATAVVGKTIKSAEVNWHKMVKPLTIEDFQKKVIGKKIINVSRRAKMLVLKLSGAEFLIFHLKLTGQLIFQPKDPLLASPLSRGRKGEAALRFSPPARGGVAGGRGGGRGGEKTARGFGQLLSFSSPLRRGRLGGGLIAGGHPQKGGLENLPNKFTHGILNFKDGSKLYFNDLRKFGWMRLVDAAHINRVSNEHGVEPMSKEFTLERFQEILKKYPKRNIKMVLMDQSLIAGIGNIYNDESCFCAKILPTRLVQKLKAAEIKTLYQCVKKILNLAIAKKGTSADTYLQLNGQPGGFVPYLKVYGRKGQKCKRCSQIIKRIKLNGRGTHFCDSCQK